LWQRTLAEAKIAPEIAGLAVLMLTTVVPGSSFPRAAVATADMAEIEHGFAGRLLRRVSARAARALPPAAPGTGSIVCCANPNVELAGGSCSHPRVRLGEDVAAARDERRRAAAETVGAVLGTFLPLKKMTLRPASYVSLERHLLRYAKPLHPIGLAAVTRRDVGSLLGTLATSSGIPSANRARASLSAFFIATPRPLRAGSSKFRFLVNYAYDKEICVDAQSR
jgi:hypothetical protein